MSGVEITQADEELGVKFWRVHPDEIIAEGLTRPDWYTREIARHRQSATAPLIAALEEARGALGALGLRELVAGWNGENREDGPYEPHPPKLGVTLRTNAGAVYKLDATLTRITETLAKHKGNSDA